MVTVMLKYSAGINRRDGQSDTPIHLALQCPGCSDIVQLLVKHGADLKLKSGDDTNCLVMAIQTGNLAKISSPLDAGWGFEDLTPAYWKALGLFSATQDEEYCNYLSYGHNLPRSYAKDIYKTEQP
jgi:ankyrin repeat protein